MRWTYGMLSLCLTLTVARGGDRFPFVIPGDDATRSATDLSGLNRKPAGADGFVRIRDGRFHTDNGRLRIWGMNLCFGANFPSHEAAEKAAAHLAKLGVNGIRIHHHDGQGTPNGIWGEIVSGKRVFNPDQLDRQDYFLDQLIKHGLYINLNLHVSRGFMDAEGFAGLDKLPRKERMRKNKFLLYFVPRMRELFKDYCRMYLTHMNPYRTLRRVDDPGIAMIEIVNENAFSKLGPGRARSLPAPYREEFKRQWNAWLRARYGTTAALRRAWQNTSEPLGPDIADMGELGSKLAPWRLQASPAFPVRPVFGMPGPEPGTKALKLDILKKSQGKNRQQLMLTNLPVKQGRLYTLSFWIRADKPRSVFVDVSNQGPDHWDHVGCGQTVKASTEWTEFVRVFRATKTVPDNTRICFKIGDSDVDLYLANVRLRRGGRLQALPEGQTLERGDIDIPRSEWVDTATADARQFMIDTEEGFLKDMVRFLREELGVRVPITAGQISYHAPGVIAKTSDYTDMHAYWQIPVGPRRWADGWRIGNTPIERSPAGQTAFVKAAARRLFDRPFTMSECNIANPNDYGASLVPTLAMIAALQDWDGIFFFTYHNRQDLWFGDWMQRFHVFTGQPVKLAMLTACANMFRRGDLAPLRQTAVGTLDEHASAALALSHRVGVDAETRSSRAPEIAASTKRLASPDGRVVWDATNPAKACVKVNTPASRAVWDLIAGQTFALGGLTLDVGPIERDYGAIVVTSLDGKPLQASRRMLLTAVGSAENLNMGWNKDRTSVGKDWGTGPTHVNGIPAAITLENRIRAVYALDGRGMRMDSVRATAHAGRTTFAIGPEHRTLWYELTAE